MVTIRPATLQDADAIAHVHVQSWLTTYAGIVPQAYLSTLDETARTASWREWLALTVQVFVAELDGQIVGFTSGGPLREPLQNYDAELYTIYLLQPAQGRGIGTSLLKTLSQSLTEQSLTAMVVWVLEQNPACRFYERFGAVPLSSKEIEIGGATLTEVAYGWPDLKLLT
jgi:L-amino acid N-acyltransferase YncA